MYDRYQLIDSMIVDLNRLEVKGVENMQIVLNTIGKLAALKDGLKEEETKERGDTLGDQTTVC